MMLRIAAVLALTLPASLGLGCDSTPMPIPPSINVEALTIEEATGPVGECPEPLCVVVSGASGATDPDVHLVVHRLTRMAPDLPPAAATVAARDGSFGVVLGGMPLGGYRIIARSDDGTTVLDFAPDPAGAPPRWRAVPYTERGAAACVEISPASLDFGAVREGFVATEVVEVRNGCDVTVDLFEAQVPHVPFAPGGPAFDVVSRPTTLEPDESVGMVVVFWPQGTERYTGALLLDVGHPAAPEIQVRSAPIGGRSTPP